MSKLCETLLICEILLECSVAAPKKEENEKKLKSEATIKKDFEVFFFACVSVCVFVCPVAHLVSMLVIT